MNKFLLICRTILVLSILAFLFSCCYFNNRQPGAKPLNYDIRYNHSQVYVYILSECFDVLPLHEIGEELLIDNICSALIADSSRIIKGLRRPLRFAIENTTRLKEHQRNLTFLVSGYHADTPITIKAAAIP